MLMSPETLKRIKGKTAPVWPDGTPAAYALDNGAWTAYQKGKPFDVAAFEWAVDTIGQGADWVVMPDCVGDKAETLRMAEQWHGRLDGMRVLFAVQDGMTVDEVAHWLGKTWGLFVGGTTEWKLATIHQWGALAKEHGKWCHVGRVNTGKRIRLCHAHGVNSIDGTSVTRFPKTLTYLDKCIRQASLFEEGAR